MLRPPVPSGPTGGAGGRPPGSAAAQLARLAAERSFQPARVGLPARQLPGGDRAGTGGEDVEQHLRGQGGATDFGGLVPCAVGVRCGHHQAVELGLQLGVALHDRVDGNLRVKQRGRQADVRDDGEARRFQRGLLLVVEEAGEEPPVQDLTAVVEGIGSSHLRSSLPARSCSTDDGVGGGLLGLDAILVGRAPGPSPGVDRDGLLPHGGLDGERLHAERPGVPAEQPDAGTGRRDGLGGERSGGRNAIGVDGERVAGHDERQCVLVLPDGVALQENGYGDARRVPVQRCGRRVGGGGQGDAGGGEGVGGFPGRA